MGAQWQPSVAFLERVSKPTLLKILSEQCGEQAAENCAGLKKADLALAMFVTKNWRTTFRIDANEIKIIDLDYEDYH